MTHITASAAFVAIAIPLAGAMAEALSPASVFEGNATTLAKNGTTQGVHVTVQAWGITGQDHATHEMPLRGFYVAHLISGHVSATIGGQTTEHLPGDYWAVKPDAAMQVKVIGEVAVLETTVVAKQ